MVKVLANDGISLEGENILKDAGFTVKTEKIPQEQLVESLNAYDAVIVRSATKITSEIIEASPNLKLIGRAGVGLDNIDVKFAESKGIKVVNTPAASSLSVAELVIAHLLSVTRFLFLANREMPEKGATDFKGLKKSYSKAIEVRGKTMGIFGLGKIGQETAKLALGLGMNVIACDPAIEEVEIKLDQIPTKPSPVFSLNTISKDELLAQADFISLHVPALEKPLIDGHDFNKMKEGVIIINCARGGTLDEEALIEALDNGKVAFAALDVFKFEPNPDVRLMKHPHISLSPHVGGSTVEAQQRVGIEIAEKTVQFFKSL